MKLIHVDVYVIHGGKAFCGAADSHSCDASQRTRVDNSRESSGARNASKRLVLILVLLLVMTTAVSDEADDDLTTAVLFDVGGLPRMSE